MNSNYFFIFSTVSFHLSLRTGTLTKGQQLISCTILFKTSGMLHDITFNTSISFQSPCSQKGLICHGESITHAQLSAFNMNIKWSKGGYMVINYIQLCLLCSYITFIICLNYNFCLLTATLKCCKRSFRKSVSPENNFLGRNYLRYFWELWREDSGAFDNFLLTSTGKSICLYNLIVKVLMTNMTIRNQSID